MAPINKTWSDTPPPPLPSYPPAADTDGPATTRWLLVSFAGRAGVEIRRRCVVGSGPSCDLCLVEWGISPHHALLTVEESELFITPLSDSATRVDGRALETRVRLSADSVVTFADIDFVVQAQVPETPVAYVHLGTPDDQFDPLPEFVAPHETPRADTTPDRQPTARRRTIAPLSLGIAVPLALFALWFYRADQWPAQLDLIADDAGTVSQPAAPMSSSPPDDTAPMPAPSLPLPTQAEVEVTEVAASLPAAAVEAPPIEGIPTAVGAPFDEAAVEVETVDSGAQPPQSDPSAVAVVAPSQPEPVAPDVVAEPTPVAAVADGAVSTARVEIAAPPPRGDVGPPLIFLPPPPLVAFDEQVAQLEAIDTRVKPPWSDGPPIAAVAAPIAPDVVAEPAPIATVTDAAPLPEPESAAAPPREFGQPLIFPPAPPLVDVAHLEAIDARVKPPWSGGPPVVVSADAPSLIFPARPPLVDLQALATADARVRPPWSDVPPTVAGVHADGSAQAAAVATLLFEAGRLYSRGDLVTPAHQNAAALYVRVLTLAPKTRIARTRLSNIVGWIALDAGDMLRERRGDGARDVLAQLSNAVPKVQRAHVDAAPMRRWRVAELLVDADALMQKRRISGPAKPNAVGLLREALRIEPHNTMAEQMLSRAFSLVADAQRR